MRLSTSLRLNAQKGLVTPYDPTLTLSLQFAARQAYVSDFGPLPTFTNASTTRTYVGSDGLLKTAATNVPRIEFDPITRQCLGLLIEEQRANLFTWSEDATQTSWFKSGTTASANQTVAPDGATTADLVAETTANAQHFIRIANGVAVTDTTTYTGSVFLKKGTGSTAPDWVVIQSAWANFSKSFAFNLTTGAVGATFGSPSYTIKQYPNGWWRVSFTAAAVGTNNNGYLLLFFSNNTNVAVGPTYTGQTTSDIFVWGAQFEAGSFASSYIPTVATAPLTRSADVCSITGAAFTGFYNQTEGAMVFKGSRIGLQPSPVPGYIQIDDGTVSERILLYNSAGSEDYLVTDNGLISANLSAGASFPNNTLFGLSARYKVNDFAVSRSGASPVTIASGSVPTTTAFRIGNRNTAGFHNGHIHTIQYFNAIKTNAQLQALSTP